MLLLYIEFYNDLIDGNTSQAGFMYFTAITSNGPQLILAITLVILIYASSGWYLG